MWQRQEPGLTSTPVPGSWVVPDLLACAQTVFLLDVLGCPALPSSWEPVLSTCWKAFSTLEGVVPEVLVALGDTQMMGQGKGSSEGLPFSGVVVHQAQFSCCCVALSSEHMNMDVSPCGYEPVHRTSLPSALILYLDQSVPHCHSQGSSFLPRWTPVGQPQPLVLPSSGTLHAGAWTKYVERHIAAN